ncbi:hypothetical protein Tco_1164214 [Tanacetum coccineum]
MAFLSAEDTSSSNEVNTTNGVSTASGHNSQGKASSSSYTDDLMKTGRKLIFNGKEPVGFDKTKVECFNCKGPFCKGNESTKIQGNNNERSGKGSGQHQRTVPVETSDSLVVQDNALISKMDWDDADDQSNKIGLDDSVYRPIANKTSASVSQVEASTSQTSNTSVEMPRVESVRPSGVIIEDWVSDDEDIFQSNDLQATDKPSFKRIEFTNARNESVKPKQAEKPRIITQNPKVDRRDWNGQMTQKLGLGFGFTKKACFVCGSYSHLIKDCDFHEKRMANKSVLKDMGKVTGHREVRPVWNNTQRINHQNKFVPSAVLTRSRRVPVSAAKQSSFRAAASTGAVKQVNTATHTNRVNVSKLRTNAFHKSNSPIRSTVKGNGVTAIKASAGYVWRPKMTDLNIVSKDNSGSWVSKRGNPQQALKNKGIFDSGCSRHMTGNKDFLTDYQDIDGGFVAFGGSARGGKITGKGKIRTDKLDFEDVFFVKELKFNLFSVSQMCDKKNNVLFTETECLVLSPDFKLLDESQVLLRVPRQSNMYNFDLKNVVPSGDLTCLFAKAIMMILNYGIELEGKATKASYPLGKFDGKAEEGFLVGQGPNWLFDIDSLTNSMKYQPVTAGNQTNKNAGLQEANGDTGLKKSVDDRQYEEKNVSSQQYIMFALWSSISSSYKSSDESYKYDTANDAAGETLVQKPASENEQALKNVLDKMMDQEKEAKEQSDIARKYTPVNVAGTPRTSNDAAPSFVPLGGSFPDDPLMLDLEDTAEV